MKRIIFMLLSVLFIFQSCGTRKNTVHATGEVKDQALSKFYTDYVKQLPSFEGLQIKSRIKADVKGKSVNATLKLYVENGEKIWANASMLGITGARAEITPNGVKAYNVLDKTYIDGDFSYFNQKLKVNFLDYNKLQELLLGQLFLISDINDYELSTNEENQYVLAYKLNEKLKRKPLKGKYIHTFYLDSNYRLRKVEIEDSESQTQVSVTYDEWQQIENKNLPSFVKVLIKQKGDDSIELDYNNFVFEKTDPPFRIPSGYKKQELN